MRYKVQSTKISELMLSNYAYTYRFEILDSESKQRKNDLQRLLKVVSNCAINGQDTSIRLSISGL